MKHEEIENSNILDEAYKDLLSKGFRGFADREKIPDLHSFLRYLTQEKDHLIHGSNNKEITELEQRKANCKSKKFGNQTGVYALKDEMIPIFFAIKDTDKAYRAGVDSFSSQSGFRLHEDKKDYIFKMTKEFIDADAWSDGAIYILDKTTFVQGKDDTGKQIDEWISKGAVVPIGKIEITKEDFPYFDKIEPINNER